jgi:SAM-dependent methyltransferase
MVRYNITMDESDEFWDFFWEVRLHELEDLGKREAILAVSKLVRSLAGRPDQPVRLLELGCGEGQIIGALVEAHAQVDGIHTSCGVDYSHQAIEKCRRAYSGMTFIEGDFTDQNLVEKLGQFGVVLLVNSLHEVFSSAYSPELGEVAVLDGKRGVEQALASAASCLAPGGYLVLFDGLEYSGDLHEQLCIRFLSWQARRRFETFAREYQPFRISFRELGDPLLVELSLRDFTRYITKSIFLGKRLWQTERLESYQYFNQAEFRAAFAHLGLAINELRTLTVDYEKWSSEVEIVTPNVDFPAEHILIVARQPGSI